MICLKLFFTFFKIGAFSFGGGYGMISIIREACLSYGWLSEEAVMNFIAVAESTPGPIAVNMATFVGSSQAGFLGAIVATLGLILPSFFVILAIAAVIKNFIKLKAVQAVLRGVRPVVVGLILATAITMFLSTILGITAIGSGIAFSGWAVLILVSLIIVSFIYKKLTHQTISPVFLILLSAVLGIAIY